MPKGMHNPLPASLRSECKKASQILDSFLNGSWRGSPGKELPSRVLANAKGLVILTVSKAGFLGSVRFGSGILVARLSDGRWSYPSAIGTAGVGAGGQVGFELTDFVFILNDEGAVKTFSRLGSVTLSGNFSIAFGPLGRNAEYASGANGKGVASMYSFCKTKGLFGGVSIEGGMLVERRWANKRFYGGKVTAGEILGGSVEPLERGDVEELMRVLDSQVFKPVSQASEASHASEAPEASHEASHEASQEVPQEVPQEVSQEGDAQAAAHSHICVESSPETNTAADKGKAPAQESHVS